jgi:hypothetical protein
MDKTANNRVINYFAYGNIFKTREAAEKFVRDIKGDTKNVEFIDMSGRTYSGIVTELQARHGIAPTSIGIRATEKDGLSARTAAEKVPGVVLEVQPIEGTDIYAAIDSYRMLLKAMAQAGEGIALDSIALPGLELDKMRGIFRYLPKTLPIDYSEEISRYQTAVKLIQAAA